MFWLLLLVFFIVPIAWHARTFESAQASCGSALLSGAVAGLATGWSQASPALGFITFFPATFIALGYGAVIGILLRRFGSDARRAHAEEAGQAEEAALLQPVPSGHPPIGTVGILLVGLAVLFVAAAYQWQTGEWTLRPRAGLAVISFCLLCGAAVLVRIFAARRMLAGHPTFLRSFLLPFAISYPVWGSVLAIPILRISPQIYWPVAFMALAGLLDWSAHIRRLLPTAVTRRLPVGGALWFVVGMAVAFVTEWLVQCAWLRWCK